MVVTNSGLLRVAVTCLKLVIRAIGGCGVPERITGRKMLLPPLRRMTSHVQSLTVAPVASLVAAPNP